jgi:AAA domain
MTDWHADPFADQDEAVRAAGGATPNPEFEIHDAGDIDLTPIPPREWVLGTRYCVGFVSGSLGDGGVGKTALALVEALAIATQKNLTGDYVFRRENVLIVCLEDDLKEIRRRIKAAMLHHQIDPEMVKGRLFYCTHKGEKLIAYGARGEVVAGRLGSMIRAAVRKHNARVIIIDPLVKAHAVDENNNIDMDAVIDALVALAAEEDVAIMLSHHTRKGANEPGNADVGRGATAVKNGARLVYTTTRMATDERKAFGLAEEQAAVLIRVDSAKVNLCPSSHARWFRLIGIRLGNPNEAYPNGDEVQTVERWAPPDTFAGLTTAKINEILDQIDRGMPDGGRYSDHSAAKTRAAWRVVQEHARDKNEKQSRLIISTWKENDVLISKPYHDPKRGEETTGLYVNHANRPGPR